MVRFISGMGYDGRMTSHHDIKVQVTHYHREGYLPSADGGEIREEMPLREFLERIFRDDPRSIENELYRISKCVAGGFQYNKDELSRVLHKYDQMYSELIRRGKLVLAQHKITQRMTGGLGGIDPYQNGQFDQRVLMAQRKDDMAEKSAMDYYRQDMLREAAYYPTGGITKTGPTDRETANAQATLIKREEEKEKKKRDDDLFFLTT